MSENSTLTCSNSGCRPPQAISRRAYARPRLVQSSSYSSRARLFVRSSSQIHCQRASTARAVLCGCMGLSIIWLSPFARRLAKGDSQMMLNPMHPHSTARAVDARWQWICELLRTKRRARDEYDDDWTRRGLAYARRLIACGGRQPEFEQVRVEFSDILAAQRLYFNATKMEGAV